MRSPSEIQAERERLEAVRGRIDNAIELQLAALAGAQIHTADPLFTELIADANRWLEGRTELPPSKSLEGSV